MVIAEVQSQARVHEIIEDNIFRKNIQEHGEEGGDSACSAYLSAISNNGLQKVDGKDDSIVRGRRLNQMILDLG